MLNIIATDFDIKQIMECGQIFRYIKKSDTNYIIYSGDKKVEVKQKPYCLGENDELIYAKYIYGATDNPKVLVNFDCDIHDFESYWEDYFDLKTDYSYIKNKLATHGEDMKLAMNFGGGIRILRQQAFETIIAFIISANNNISRIQKILFLLCEKYGEKICKVVERKNIDKTNFAAKTIEEYYAFPLPEQLALISCEQLRTECNVGYRDKYIVESSKLIHQKQIDIYSLGECSTELLLDELKKLVGVGQKVADCIALFAYSRGEVFPVDVWTKRVFEKLYVGHIIAKTQVHKQVHEKFGEYAGYAQQYLFYYGREHNW